MDEIHIVCKSETMMGKKGQGNGEACRALRRLPVYSAGVTCRDFIIRPDASVKCQTGRQGNEK